MIQFRTVSETPCGYWITDLNNGYGRFSKRWVSKTTRKRFAYPTIEEAKNSYIIRKRRQQEYLESLLEKTKAMLTYMDEDPEEEYFSDPNQG